MQKQNAEVGKIYRTALVPELRTIDEQSRTIEFVASTEAVDRYGDIIRVAGWKLDAYKKNPVFLWAHRSGEPPIGKTVGIHVENAPVPALVQKVEFADKETYPFADTVFNLYKGKFLRAVSVGFMPLEQPKRIKDAEYNTTGWEFTNQELLELSAVPVPANPEAVARMVSKGFGSEADLRRVFSGEAPNVDRELAELSISMARLAVSLAQRVVRESLALVKNFRPEDGGEMTYAELLALLKSPKAETDDEVNSIEQLGEALETDCDIETLDDLAAAVGSGTDEPLSDDETFSDSRKWRTGKFSLVRELR